MIIFLGFIQDSKVNTPPFYFAWDFFPPKRVERIYVRKKAELPQNTASRKNEISPCPTYIPAEERKKKMRN